MNREQLRRRVRIRLSLPENGHPRLIEPTQNANLDEALRRICLKKRWPWLLTTSALSWPSVATAAVPDDMIGVRRVTITPASGNPVLARYVDLDVFLQTERMACVWTHIGRTIALSPTPTTTVTVTLYYYRLEPSLATDASEPLLPEHYQDAVVHYAAHLGALATQDAQLAADELGLFDRFVNDMDDGANGAPAGRHVRTQKEIRSSYAAWT